jgi:hypothetical protein
MPSDENQARWWGTALCKLHFGNTEDNYYQTCQDLSKEKDELFNKIKELSGIRIRKTEKKKKNRDC